jgi:20S proteasome alpha/beta subunit
MTTIAYRDGVLAGDTRAMYGDVCEAGVIRKVHRARDGRLIGQCGLSAKVQPYAQALASGKVALPEIPRDDGRVIEVMPDGVVWIHEVGGKHSLGKLECGAWGSGASIARGALEMGAGARQAVLIARKLDPYTGGRVQSVSL